jgi:hypothetical protein
MLWYTFSHTKEISFKDLMDGHGTGASIFGIVFFFSREQVVHQGMDLLRAGFYLFRGDRQGFNE